MTTKIVVVAHPECPDAQFEPSNNSWFALMKALKLKELKLNALKPSEKKEKRKLLATSELHIQRFAKKMAMHLGVDITPCDCLMGKDEFDCVDDYVDETDYLVVIAESDVADALVSHLSDSTGRNSTHKRTMEMRPIHLYEI